jgi:hypothetical protein
MESEIQRALPTGIPDKTPDGIYRMTTIKQVARPAFGGDPDMARGIWYDPITVDLQDVDDFFHTARDKEACDARTFWAPNIRNDAIQHAIKLERLRWRKTRRRLKNGALSPRAFKHQ